jgi:alkaline phosphatase
MFLNLKKINIAIAITVGSLAFAQNYTVHSHNDYEQKVPFWYALGAGAKSIEADVYLVDNNLYVSHEQQEYSKERTF